jgi:hypothetical protein
MNYTHPSIEGGWHLWDGRWSCCSRLVVCHVCHVFLVFWLSCSLADEDGVGCLQAGWLIMPLPK